MSSVALVVCWDRFFTSAATTANPLPASPARAASIVAFNASSDAVISVFRQRFDADDIAVATDENVANEGNFLGELQHKLDLSPGLIFAVGEEI